MAQRKAWGSGEGRLRRSQAAHRQRDHDRRRPPGRVAEWKKQALDGLPQVFSARGAREAKDEEALRAALYQQIGQLKVELDWLREKGGISRSR